MSESMGQSSSPVSASGADEAGFAYQDAACSCAHPYLLPALFAELDRLDLAGEPKRLMDVGCGNGSVGAKLVERGWTVVGVDPSPDAIEHARAHPEVQAHRGSVYEPLHETYGTFPVVVSLEVVEHVYDPRRLARTVFDLLEPGGTAIISTPYHGFWKNLALALTNKWDQHLNPLWDHGHIKFWSIATLSALLREAGFAHLRFRRVGRVPMLAKSMIAICERPR